MTYVFYFNIVFFTFVVIISIINTGILGYTIKNYVNKSISSETKGLGKYSNFTVNLIKLTFIFVILHFLFVYYLNSNIIYLNDEIFTIDNVKIKVQGANILADSIGSGASFAAGLTTAVKLIKNTSLPAPIKLLFTGISGTSALLLFKSINNVGLTNLNADSASIVIEAKDIKINSSILHTEGIAARIIQEGKEKFKTESLVEQVASSSKFNASSPLEDEGVRYVSNLLELLDNVLILNTLMCVLILCTIMFFTFKNISMVNITWIKNLYYGDKLYSAVSYLLSLWSRTTVLWVYAGLFFILIIAAFDTYFLLHLSTSFHKLFRF